jgi:hypothetical protein
MNIIRKNNTLSSLPGRIHEEYSDKSDTTLKYHKKNELYYVFLWIYSHEKQHGHTVGSV